MQVFRNLKSSLEVSESFFVVAGLESLTTSGKAAVHIGLGNGKFAAFARGEGMTKHDLEGFFVLAAGVVSLGQFEGHIVTGVFRHLSLEVFGSFFAGYADGGHQEADFVEQLLVTGLEVNGLLLIFKSFSLLAQVAVASNGQVSVRNVEVGRGDGGLLPAFFGVSIMLLVVDNVAQEVPSGAIQFVGLDSGFQNLDFGETIGEDLDDGVLGGFFAGSLGLAAFAHLFVSEAQGIESHGGSATGSLQTFEDFSSSSVIAGALNVEGNVQTGLGRVGGHELFIIEGFDGFAIDLDLDVAGQLVQRIVGKDGVDALLGAFDLTKLPQSVSGVGAGQGVSRFLVESLFGVEEHLFVVALAAVESSDEGHGLTNGVVAPGSLVEGVVSLLVVFLIEVAQTEQVADGAILRVGVVSVLDSQSLFQIFDSFVHLAGTVEVFTHADEGGQMSRIVLEGFQVIFVGLVDRITILIDVQAGDVVVLGIVELVGGGDTGVVLGDMDIVRGDFGVAGNLFAAGAEELDSILFVAENDVPFLAFAGSDGDLFFQNELFAVKYLEGAVFHDLGDIQANLAFGTGLVNGNGGIQVSEGDVLDVLGGIPVLAEALGFVGSQPGEVGLVVGVGTGHQFGVRSIGVGQSVFPVFSVGAVAPGEHLLTRRDVVVGNVNGAAFLFVVVAAEEVEIGGSCEVGVSGTGILVPGNIGGSFEAFGTILALGDGEGDVASVIVMVSPGYIGGEDQTILFVYADSGIFPPEEGMLGGGTVGNLDAGFKEAGIRMEDDTYHTLGTVGGIAFAHPADGGAVFFGFDGVVYRQNGGRTMVERPVEFNTAGDPGAEGTDQSGLDDVLTIEEMIVILLVVSFEYTAAQGGDHADANVVVFKTNDFPFFVSAMDTVNLVDNTVGVGVAAGALMAAGFGIHGHFFCGREGISGDCPLFYYRNYGLAHSEFPSFLYSRIGGRGAFSHGPFLSQIYHTFRVIARGFFRFRPLLPPVFLFISDRIIFNLTSKMSILPNIRLVLSPFETFFSGRDKFVCRFCTTF